MSLHRLGFDLAPADAPHPAGVRRAAAELFAALRARGEFEWIALRPRPRRSSLAWRQVDLPRLARTERLAGLHSPVSAFPLRARVAVAHTVHELPWRAGARENAGLVHRLWARRGSRRAAATVVPSARVAQGLAAEAPGARIAVVSHGIDAELIAAAPVPAGERRGLLQLGATRPKKALDASLRALAELARAGGIDDVALQLTFTGPPGATADAALILARELDVRARHVEHWSRAELRRELAQAAALLCPSRSEGFGLPVLEALACGTPAVVRAGFAPHPALERHVVEVLPEDPTAFAAGIRHALGTPAPERARARDAAAEFTWDAAAAAVDGLWRSLL